MTDPRLQRLVRDLIAQDASLQGREADLTRVIDALLANDPAETPSPAFIATLREDLRVHAEGLKSTPMSRWTRILPMLLTSSAAVTAVLLITLPFAQEALKNSGQPPEIPTVDESGRDRMIAPYSTGTENQNVNVEDGAQEMMLRQESVPANEPDGMGGGIDNAGIAPPVPMAPVSDPDTPVASPDAAAGTAPAMDEPSMMMQAEPAAGRKMAQPEITIPAGLTVPPQLPGTALMHDPERGDRMINVYSLPSADDARYEILAQVIRRIGEQAAPQSIDAGMPKEIVIAYPFDSLPGPVEVYAWSFSEIRIDGRLIDTFLSDPVIVPLQLPTYE